MSTPPLAACFSLRRTLTALMFAGVSQLYAQIPTSAPSASDLAKFDKNKNGQLDPDEVAQQRAEEVLTLSPFEVNTNKDVGYAAGNTLSGGRVDTPLAITPGSISVMTKEFMDDFNITNMNEAGGWMIGFDLGTPVPNSNPSAESVYQNIVRGAPSTDNFPTRNGSINFGAADSYNTERYEFQRGPDTAMFGDGGPGGRQGSTSKRARFNATSTSISAQMDSWNGYRSTLDYSKGWDRFGLRFNALTQNAPGYQDGMNKFKNAATLNVVAKLTKNTLVVAEYERVGEWNNLWSITNGDAQNGWDGVTVNANNSALLANSNSSLNAVGLERMTVAANGSAPNMFVWNFATNSMLDYGGNQYRTRGVFGPNLRIPYEGNPELLAIPARRASIAGMAPRFSAAPKDNVADRDADTASLTIEHRVGNLFLRGGFVKNDFDNNTIWSNTSPNAAIIDVNRLLPNGAVNPRYLRYFTDVAQDNLYSQDAVKEYFAQASYRFFVPRWWDYKQMLSLNLRDRETRSEAATRAWRRTDNPGAATTAALADPFNNANRFFYRVYWDDPRADLAPILTNPNGRAIGKWAYVESDGRITKRGVRSASLTSQSTFFNDNLSLTISYSRDKVDVKNLPRLAGGLAGSTGAAGGYKNLLGYQNTPGRAYTREETVHSIAFGVVTYPFRREKPSLFTKLAGPLGFVFNYAENHQPPSTGVQNPLIDGSEPELTHSKTKDYGLRYSIPGGKAYLTLSHYETDQIDNPSNFGSGSDITNIWINLGYTDPKLITTTQGSGFAYSDPNSRRLEGWEAELVANPTRNITLSLNYSHPLSYIIKESEARQAYVAAHRTEWEAGAALPQGHRFADGRVLLDPTIIRQRLDAIDNSLAGLTTGTMENGRERHRINANARYRFNEGILRGLAFVAGVQYRGHQKSGSRDTRLKFGIPDSVPNSAITTEQNVAAAFDYLWAPPNWKHTITLGANYAHRFGRYNWRFQVNVTNPFNVLDPIWGRSGPAGSAYNVAATNAFNAGNPRTQFLYSFVNPDPRKITFTTTVSF
jgi:hypothetical protein